MTQDKSSTNEFPKTPELIRTFLQAADEAFDYLSDSQVSTEIRVVSNNSLMLIEENDLDQYPRSFFYVERTFKIGGYILCLTYGDKEFFINATVSFPQSSVRNEYGLWEWVEALGVLETVEVSGNFVGDIERIKRIVNHISDIFRKYLYPMKCVDDNLLLKLKESRDMRRLEEQRRFQQKEHKRVLRLASEAFSGKNFAKVVELLTLYENSLIPSELKKLKYSRDKLV